MALRLGELVAYLKADNTKFDKGLDKAERDFKATGRELEEQAKKTGVGIGDGLIRGADGRLRDAHGRFVAGGGAAGAASAVGFLGSFGMQLGGKLPGVVGGAFSGLPPQVQGVVAVAAAAVGAVFVTALGAAITAGILLTLGGGVLAVGITQAVKDPAVAAAWKQFGDRAKASLTGFTDAFKGPVSRAAKTFGDMMERLEPSFTRIGEVMAPIIDKLAPAFAGLAENAMPGIETAVRAAAPLFEKIAEHAPKIGEAIGKFFEIVAAGAPGATEFLDDVFQFIEWFLPKLGMVFATLSLGYTATKEGIKDAWHWVTDTWDKVVGFFKNLPGRISRAASGLWDGLKNSFKSAVNWLIRKWNDFSLTLGGGSVLGLGIPSVTLNTPNIPLLEGGGIVPATRGGRLAVVGEGGEDEAVAPLSKLAGMIRDAVNGASARTGAGQGDTHVYVEIDGQQLEGRIVRVVRERDRTLRRRAIAGAGVSI